ncbi:MAG: penicillin acylase family protein [Methylococcaceae bacterium]|nr:penicillin acylase family protein [Methylococcaceae bacterium]
MSKNIRPKGRVGRFVRRTVLVLSALSALAAGGIYLLLRASLPTPEGRFTLTGLSAPVKVETDAQGVPAISAQSREDAFLALGFVTARDRLFQMDLLRRQAAGRLAEILGPSLISTDRLQRVAGFEQVAHAARQRLPHDQQAVLQAFTDGVNQALAGQSILPFEFLLLGYKPEPWRAEDSLLVVLGMEENLGWTGESEHMASVMEAALPASVYAFFSPTLDHYTDRLLNGPLSRMASPAIPGKELAALLGQAPAEERRAEGILDTPLPKGSNGWVVGRSKTWDGRAILANDMHLALRVPNIWYQAEIRYGDVTVRGVTLPGVPLVVAGSNGKVAWGFTNIEGDFVDLVSLETDPGDPGRYRTPQGFVPFGERLEILHVRGGADQTLKVLTTLWGPVMPDPLLGRQVAVRWTALDPEATDLTLMDLDQVSDVHAAQALFNRAGGPPLNALAADSQGNIGWTYSGKIPLRFGFDGSVSRSWADGTRGWKGYIPPQELPRVVNPPSGFIANANQRMLGKDYPYVIGHDFDHGHRAHRISERLAETGKMTERDMFALQLDTRAEFYRYYQRLALSLPGQGNDAEQDARLALEAWDGAAERESEGFALLVEFRRLLLEEIVAPYMAPCRTLDSKFRLHRAAIDEPLQQILNARLPELLPHRERYRDWDTFLHELLMQAQHNVSAHHKSPERLVWGEVNRVAIAHPFSSALPWLKAWLDMPAEPVSGCPECVRAYSASHGASERLVVSPGHESGGFLHMPGGQSGHPLSPHYRSQHGAWVEGKVLPFATGRPFHRLELLPPGQAGTGEES